MPAPTPVSRSCLPLRLLIGAALGLAASAWWSSPPAPESAPRRNTAAIPQIIPPRTANVGTEPIRSRAHAATPAALTAEQAVRLALVRANTDLPAAIAWAESLPSTSPAPRTAALQAVADEALRTDALVALRLLTPEPASPERDTLLRRAAMELAVDDPDALATWAETFPSGALHDELLSGVALVWSERDPRQAAALATTDLTAGRLRDDTLVGIAQRWVQKEPSQAAAWVASLPADETRHAAIENVALTWARTDPDAAERWLGALVAQTTPH